MDIGMPGNIHTNLLIAPALLFIGIFCTTTLAFRIQNNHLLNLSIIKSPKNSQFYFYFVKPAQPYMHKHNTSCPLISLSKDIAKL